MTFRFSANLAAMCCLALFSTNASALGTCNFVNLTGQLVNFGKYASQLTGAVPVVGTGDITVQCDTATSITVSASEGNGSYASRKLINGTSELTYNLFHDPAYLLVFGTGPIGFGASQGSITTVCPVANQDCTTTVYGKIDGNQSGPSGIYSDTLDITINF